MLTAPVHLSAPVNVLKGLAGFQLERVDAGIVLYLFHLSPGTGSDFIYSILVHYKKDSSSLRMLLMSLITFIDWLRYIRVDPKAK